MWNKEASLITARLRVSEDFQHYVFKQYSYVRSSKQKSSVRLQFINLITWLKISVCFKVLSTADKAIYYIYMWPRQMYNGIRRLHLCWEVKPYNDCPGYDIKTSDSEIPFLEFWGIQSIPSLHLLPDPLWPGVVVPLRVLYMGQIELSFSLLKTI